MTEIILHAVEFQNERGFIEWEINKNLRGKLDTYITKHKKEDGKIRVEVTLVRGKHGINGKVHITISGQSFHVEREDFEKLEDLINHLFSHLKDQLAK